MPDTSPKISILIPTYNRSGYLAEAVESVLAQSYPRIEVIVSDNASTDDTETVAGKYSRDPRFKYYKNTANLGMVGNWRKAVRDYCSGDWFLILSDDDYLTDPDYLTKAAGLIAQHPDVSLVYADAILKNEKTGEMTRLRLPFHEVENGADIFFSRGNLGQLDFALCTVIFKRSLSLELEAFSNLNCIAADSELFLKSALRGNVGFIGAPAAVYRFHGDNLIANYKKDASLLLGYLEWCISPYNMAVGMKRFPERQLNEWRRRNILSEFASVYKGAIHYHRRGLFRLVGELIDRSGISAWEFLWINLRVWPEILFKVMRALSCACLAFFSLPGRGAVRGETLAKMGTITAEGSSTALISVAIPVYNGAEYIRESVSSVLMQKGVRLQLVVQDNASDDGTAEILRELSEQDSRILVRRNPATVPMAENWNLALNGVSGDYVMLLSADDYLLPGALEAAIHEFEERSPGAVTGNHYLNSSGRKYLRLSSVSGGIYAGFVDKLLAHNPFSINFTLFRRNVLEDMKSAGCLFKSYLLTCDFELWLRLAISGVQVYYLDVPLGVYRVHSQNLSRRSVKMTRHMALSILLHRKALREGWLKRYRFALARLIMKVLINALRTGRLDSRLLLLLFRRIMR